MLQYDFEGQVCSQPLNIPDIKILGYLNSIDELIHSFEKGSFPMGSW